jgi:hypothetical protein
VRQPYAGVDLIPQSWIYEFSYWFQNLTNYLSISQILFSEELHFSLIVGILQVGVESLVPVAHAVVDEIHVARCGGQI